MGPLNPGGWWCPYHGYCTPAAMIAWGEPRTRHCGYGDGSSKCFSQVYKLSPSDIEGIMKYWHAYMNAGAGPQEGPNLEAIVGEAIAEAALSQTIGTLRENDV